MAGSQLTLCSLLNCADTDEALERARKAAVAGRLPVEVREFLAIPAEWKANPEQKNKE